MVLAKNLQLALFHVTWSNLCMYTQNKKDQLANLGATWHKHLLSLWNQRTKRILFFPEAVRLCCPRVFSVVRSWPPGSRGFSPRALLFSLFPRVTVRCAALGGWGGGGRGGGGAGWGCAVRAIGDGPHSGLRVYRFGEVDAMDEADQLFYLLQGAVHLLLPG